MKIKFSLDKPADFVYYMLCHRTLCESLRGVAQSGSARALAAWGRGFESLHPDQLAFALSWPRGQAVKTSPFHGGNSGSSPDGVTTSSLWGRGPLAQLVRAVGS